MAFLVIIVFKETVYCCLQVTDKYGNEVTQLARPLPVEYLLVDLPAAFPVDLAFTLYADPNVRSFAMAHRSDIGEIQVRSLVIPLPREILRIRTFC